MKFKKAILLSSIGMLLLYIFKKKNSASRIRKAGVSTFVKEMVSEINEPLGKTATEIPQS